MQIGIFYFLGSDEMKVGFIGAGKVGTAFGLYLQAKGHDIVGYLSKTYQSAVASAEMTKSFAYKDYSTLMSACDLVFITTPDTYIEKVVMALLELRERSCAVAHMSGALTTKILEPLGCEVALVTLHPLLAFASIEKARQDLETCTFAVEGNQAGITIAKELLLSCSNQVITLKKEQKAMYHGTACVTANYMMVITALAEQMIASFDYEQELGLLAYRHLMIGAIENAIEFGSASALTGPIVRGDVQTIETHLESMKKKSMKKAYSTLGMMTLALATEDKLSDPVLSDGLRRLFSQVLEEEECKNEK